MDINEHALSSLAIVGIGPRGLSILERVCVNVESKLNIANTHWQRARAVTPDDASGGLRIIKLDNGSELHVNTVVLAQGHTPTNLTEEENYIRDFANNYGLSYTLNFSNSLFILPCFANNYGLSYITPSVTPSESDTIARAMLKLLLNDMTKKAIPPHNFIALGKAQKT